MSRTFAQRYRQEFGISIPEWRVLTHLTKAGAVSVRKVHARVDRAKSKVSRAASRLAAARLIMKRGHPEDGRLLDLELTEAGRALFTHIDPSPKTSSAN